MITSFGLGVAIATGIIREIKGYERREIETIPSIQDIITESVYSLNSKDSMALSLILKSQGFGNVNQIVHFMIDDRKYYSFHKLFMLVGGFPLYQIFLGMWYVKSRVQNYFLNREITDTLKQREEYIANYELYSITLPSSMFVDMYLYKDVNLWLQYIDVHVDEVNRQRARQLVKEIKHV